MAYTTINKSSDYFNTKLYSGTGSSNALTGVGFQPDWTWIKSRSNTYSHTFTDAVRGVTKHNATNNTNAQYTSTTEITSFDSDGFTLGTDAGVNNNGSTFASWNWKANGAGSANTDGSITSTVSASTTSGFSIVKWTASGGNATIGHGLGAVPKFIWVKSLANATWHMVYTSMTGNNSELGINSTNAASGSSTAWQDTDPTNQYFYVAGGAGDGVNASGDYIAYCFADVQGFSKFGSYNGNGNVDGSFIYTGFKPAWIMVKRYDSGAEDWNMWDSKRIGYNITGNDKLYADLNSVEDTGASEIDILSNGFKWRTTNGGLNNSSGSYIYMCFAEAPLVGSNNVPCTAR